jgi:hypothetical protein
MQVVGKAGNVDKQSVAKFFGSAYEWSENCQDSPYSQTFIRAAIR